MSLRSGRGSRLMSVGTATICSSLARFACRQMSMISRLYRPFKCCSQTCLIFFTASVDLNVDPFMYKRKTYFAWREWEPGRSISPGDLGFRLPAGPVFFGGFFMWIFLSLVRLPVAGASQSTSVRCWTGLQRSFGQSQEDLLPGSELLRSGRRAPCADSPKDLSL